MDERLDRAPCGYLSTAEDGTMLAVNETLAELLGQSRDALLGQGIDLILPLPSKIFYQSYLFPMVTLHGRAEEIYMTLLQHDGGRLPTLVNAARRKRGDQTVNDFIFFVVHRRHQFERELLAAKKQAETYAHALRKANAGLKQARAEVEASRQDLLVANARLEQLATTDPLTRVRNRYMFEECLDEKIRAFVRHAHLLSLLLVDADHFKTINDTLGHQQGDRVLQAIADVLRHVARDVDMVARYGGEEFAIILPETDREGALRVAERIRSGIEQAQPGGCRVTVSVGVAGLRKGDNREMLVRRADAALYRSKEQGRNRVTHADDVAEGTGSVNLILSGVGM